MRISALALGGLLCSSPLTVVAQAGWQPDLSIGVGADGYRAAVSLVRRITPVDRRFWVGAGVRGTAYAGDTVAFASRAPDDGGFEGDILVDPSVLGLNLFGEVGVHLSGRVAAGFNLDLIGLATGPDRATAAGTASPSVLSLFLYGNNDRGSLNSEVFLSVRLGATVRLRLGMSHSVMGYETPGNDGISGTRFQRFLDAGFVAIRVGG
jgi:hypothetical protein